MGVLRGALGRLNGPFILKMNVPVNLPIWDKPMSFPGIVHTLHIMLALSSCLTFRAARAIIGAAAAE